LDADIGVWWDRAAGITANEKLIEFFNTELFRHSDAPVVIFLDEIDSTLKLEYTDDFFTAIRAMYNQRAAVTNNNKIAFCLCRGRHAERADQTASNHSLQRGYDYCPARFRA